MPKNLLFYPSVRSHKTNTAMRQMAQFLQLHIQPRNWLAGLYDFLRNIPRATTHLLDEVKIIGTTADMNSTERSKLGIFNHLNLFQFITGIIVPFIGALQAGSFPVHGWIFACLPAVVSVAVLILNANYQYQAAKLVYFICYPLFICFGYINGVSLGVELCFILYGVLSVFFINDIGAMLFSIGFSMVSYFILTVVLKKYRYQLEHHNYVAYLINQGIAIVYIYYGLYLVKTENANYNRALQQTNLEIQKQADLLQQQAEELERLNSLKNKLFSVISHDLKAPMYALRNLFENMHAQDMPGGDIKEMVPDIKNDLNYTVALMENLLQWSKTQMQSHTVKAEIISIHEITEDIVNLLHLQAGEKNIRIENRAHEEAFASADRNMISLVIRNLISNSVKFTPSGGRISIGTYHQNGFIEVYVKDSGKGISAEEMEKINAMEFYTTNGTAHEQGTGLGLMLCKEFVARNGGQMRIESEPGQGSTFSFTLHVPQTLPA